MAVAPSTSITPRRSFQAFAAAVLTSSKLLPVTSRSRFFLACAAEMKEVASRSCTVSPAVVEKAA